MPVRYRDYYEILGVPLTANAEQIRAAFRRLARKYHPDVATNEVSAELKFKEINEAYEVLSDPERRRTYDSFARRYAGPDLGMFSRDGTVGSGGGRGSSYRFDGTGFSDFFEHLFGATARSGRNSPRMDPRDLTEPGGDLEADILVPLHEVAHGAIRPISFEREVTCPSCFGTAAVNGGPCPTCLGSGKTTRKETYRLRIPAGIREGQKLRITGAGEGVPGQSGGDLYLNVRYARHPDFRIVDGDLYYELEIAPWDAALGSTMQVPSLEGVTTIRIAAGAQSGQKLRLRGKGLPRSGERGDLYVVIQVHIAAASSARERSLWEELGRVAGQPARGEV